MRNLLKALSLLSFVSLLAVAVLAFWQRSAAAAPAPPADGGAGQDGGTGSARRKPVPADGSYFAASKSFAGGSLGTVPRPPPRAWFADQVSCAGGCDTVPLEAVLDLHLGRSACASSVARPPADQVQRISLRLAVTPAGAVSRAELLGAHGLAKELADCVLSDARAVSFPAGAERVVELQLRFAPTLRR